MMRARPHHQLREEVLVVVEVRLVADARYLLPLVLDGRLLELVRACERVDLQPDAAVVTHRSLRANRCFLLLEVRKRRLVLVVLLDEFFGKKRACTDAAGGRTGGGARTRLRR